MDFDLALKECKASSDRLNDKMDQILAAVTAMIEQEFNGLGSFTEQIHLKIDFSQQQQQQSQHKHGINTP